LKTTVEQCLKKGQKYIAVNFTEASYLYSGAISVLISCYKMIKEHDGHLCIIEPQQRVMDLLIQMNIDSLVDIYKSEQELLNIHA
jgi:anti-anti-sigma factor